MPGPWHTVSRRCTAFSSRSTSLSMPALSTTCRHTTCLHLPAAGEPRARCLSAACYQPCQPQKGSHPAPSPGDAAGRWQGCLAVSSHARGRLVLLQALLKGHILPVPLLVTLIRLRELGADTAQGNKGLRPASRSCFLGKAPVVSAQQITRQRSAGRSPGLCGAEVLSFCETARGDLPEPPRGVCSPGTARHAPGRAAPARPPRDQPGDPNRAGKLLGHKELRAAIPHELCPWLSLLLGFSSQAPSAQPGVRHERHQRSRSQPCPPTAAARPQGEGSEGRLRFPALHGTGQQQLPGAASSEGPDLVGGRPCDQQQ